MNLIIKESDKRYKLLDKIFSYHWSYIKELNGRNSTRYFIPPELVINEYDSGKVRIFNQDNFVDNNFNNWVKCRCAPRLINTTTGLDVEEFYNLLKVKNNDSDNYQRCSQCGNRLNFSNLGYGYCHHSWEEGKEEVFCSIPCQVNYHNSLNLGMNSTKSNVRKARSQFLLKGNITDECYLYITWCTDGRFKYGITEDLDRRCTIEYMNNNEYINPHKILSDTRLAVSNIEYELKLKFDGSEYLSKDLLHEFFNELKSILTNIDLSTPTTISKESTLK